MNDPKLSILPLKKLRAHPLSPNELNEITFQKLKENIGRTNRYPALIVRPQGKVYEIIDGHHRFLVLQELGFTEAKCEIWDIDDKETKLLLSTLNRLRGTDDVHKRAKLIKELLDDFGDDMFKHLLPESERAIDGLLKLYGKGELDIEAERGLIEEQLTQAGVDSEKAERMANLYSEPKSKMQVKFVFDDERQYNKVASFFGRKPDPNKLADLIDKYEK